VRTLYFIRWGQRQAPLLVARVGHKIISVAEYIPGAGWQLAATGAGILGLTQEDLAGVRGPGELLEHCPAVSYLTNQEQTDESCKQSQARQHQTETP